MKKIKNFKEWDKEHTGVVCYSKPTNIVIHIILYKALYSPVIW